MTRLQYVVLRMMIQAIKEKAGHKISGKFGDSQRAEISLVYLKNLKESEKANCPKKVELPAARWRNV